MKLPLKNFRKQSKPIINDTYKSDSEILFNNALNETQFDHINKSKSTTLNHYNYQIKNKSYLKGEYRSLSNYPCFTNQAKIDFHLLKQDLNKILKEIRVITNKLKKNEEDEEKLLRWKFAAMVIDRLCMVLFALATFLSFVLILASSNNFFTSNDPSDKF
jgi:hypothetical protein